jgi:cell division ATPase FtsA
VRALAADVFDLPARLATARDVAGPTSAYENPALSTPIGLVKYAQAVSAELEAPSLFDSLRGLFRRK